MSDNFNFGVIAYLPRNGVGHTDAFLANLKNFPPKHRLLLYSHERADVPGIVKLPANAEDVIPNNAEGKKNRIHVNNIVFYTGISVAASHGLTHFCYLEIDCRVGCPNWDEIIWNEFLRKNPDAVCGGSPVMFNPSAYSQSVARSYEKFLLDNPNRPVPMSVTGTGRLGERFTPCLFVNGALAVYSVPWLLKAFPEIQGHQTIKLAQETKMWDYEIGVRLWKEFGDDVFKKVVCLDNIYSGYLDVLTDEPMRKQMLESGKIVGVHQIKSDWIGPQLPIARPTINSPDFKPKVDILIVTYRPDLEFFKYAIQSIEKFAAGFNQIVTVVPEPDRNIFAYWIKKLGLKHSYKLSCQREPEGKGFLAHEVAVCCADEFCSADYILHMDSDCLFQEPVTPLDYFEHDKPVLLCRPYAAVMDKNHAQWQSRAETALGFSVPLDGMCRHPANHHRKVYSALRAQIEGVHKHPFKEWVLKGQSEFPQSFAEFPTLFGFVHEKYPDLYTFIDIKNGKEPHNKLLQGWSKKGLDYKIRWKDGKVASHKERAEAILK